MMPDSLDWSVDTYPIAAKLPESREFSSKCGGVLRTSDPSKVGEVLPKGVGGSTRRGHRAAISYRNFIRWLVGFIAVESDVDESRVRPRNPGILLGSEIVKGCDGSSSGRSIPAVVTISCLAAALKNYSS
jgi:hypothetical protein